MLAPGGKPAGRATYRSMKDDTVSGFRDLAVTTPFRCGSNLPTTSSHRRLTNDHDEYRPLCAVVRRRPVR
jgi:hypothetical protein